jgi:excisionase family DNA binding protein
MTPYYKASSVSIRLKGRPAWMAIADKDDVLLNSREVAFLLDLSPDTVNEFARRNLLPAFKKGRQWRFRKRDIASFKRQMRGVNAAA